MTVTLVADVTFLVIMLMLVRVVVVVIMRVFVLVIVRIFVSVFVGVLVGIIFLILGSEHQIFLCMRVLVSAVCFFLGVGVVFVLMRVILILCFGVIFLAMMLIFGVLFLSVIVGVFVIFLAMMMLGMMMMILNLLPIFTLDFAHHKVEQYAANYSAHRFVAKD